MTKKKKIIWIELLRIVACLGVIMLHMGSQHFRDIPVDSYSWKVSNLYHGITRFAVACFVMISGSLYLDKGRTWTPKKVIRNGFLPIAAAFTFWQCFYAVYRTVKVGKIPVLSLNFIKRIFILMSESYFHLWYLPMLLSLILIAPFLWKIVNGENGKQWEKFLLILFVLFQIIPNTLNDFPLPYKEYVVNLMNLVKPDLVTGYAGYFVLGHYLSHYDISPKLEKLVYVLAVVCGGCGIFLCQYYSIQNGKPTQAFYENFTFAAFFMSTGMMLLFKNYIGKIKWSEKAEEVICFVGGHTFGIYLIHALFRDLLQRVGADTLFMNTFIAIPLLSVLIFVLSGVSSVVIKKIPVIGKWIM